METIIYLHIPKAAGSTFSQVLKAKYQGLPMVQLFGEHGETEQFLARPQPELAQMALVIGHIPYGAHRRLPNPCRYLTVLRNPVDRVVSHYYFILRHENNYLHETVVQGGMSLEEFAASDLSWELDNLQTRLLGEGMHLGFRQVNQDTLEQALANLKSLDMVGLVEEPHKTLVLLKKALAWRTLPRVANVNVTKNRPKLSQVSPKAIHDIEKINQYDMILYQAAQELLEQRFNALSLWERRQEGFYRALREAGAGNRLDTAKAYARAAAGYITYP